MDDYWKLGEAEDVSYLREDLAARGYNKIPKRATYGALESEWSRLQCGYLHYNACTTAELRLFIAQRHLQVEAAPSDDVETDKATAKKKARAPGRRQMVNMLKDADDDPSFDKFMQLPAELQTYICELYMDFDSPLQTPVHPPLTRTCRYLRQMALPIFFGAQRFRLLYVEDYRAKKFFNTTEDRDDLCFKLDPKSRSWLGSLSPTDLARIKSLTLRFQYFDIDDIAIDLDKSPTGFTVTVGDDEHHIMDDSMRQVFKEEISRVLESVEWVEHVRRFRSKDIFALRTAIEVAGERTDMA